MRRAALVTTLAALAVPCAGAEGGGTSPWTWALGAVAAAALGAASWSARALRERSRELQRRGAELERRNRDLAAEIAERARHERRFRVACSNVSDLIYDWDLATGAVEWFGPIDEALGFAPGAFPRTEGAWNAAILDEDRERVLAQDRAHLASRAPFQCEYRVRRADGTVRAWRDSGTIVAGADGEPERWIGAITDVTATREAEAARARAVTDLRASESRLRRIVESDVVGFIFWELDGTIVDANDAFLRMVGYDRDDLAAGRVRWLEMTPPEWHPQELRKIAELNANGSIAPFEKEYLRKDGSRLPILIGGAFIDDARKRGVSYVLDLSETKRAVNALRESEERSRRLVELSPNGIVIHAGGAIAFANEAAAALLGASRPSDLVGKPVLDFVHPEHRDAEHGRMLRLVAGEPSAPVEARLVRLDGGVVDAEIRASPFTWKGQGGGYVVFSDIGARKRADEALRASEERFRQIAETIDDVFWIVDVAKRRPIYVSPAYERVFGRPAPGASADALAWRESVHPEDRGAVDIIEAAARGPVDRRVRIVRPDGAVRRVRVRAFPVRDAAGNLWRVVGLTEDVTDLDVADEQRRRLQDERDQLLERLQLQLDAMPIACLLTDESLTVTYANPAAERILGQPRNELVGSRLRDAMPVGDAAAEVDAALARLAQGEQPPPRVVAGQDPHGRAVACEWHHMPLSRTGGGFVGAMSMAIDVGERRRLEDQLRQAQKMEAIGQLAGGVAHDFNNLLSVITGYGEMHLQELASGDPRRRGVEQMIKAAKRAAALTQQLLAFGRRQVLQPRVLDLNTVVNELVAMLRRVIGEDIELDLRLAPILGRVRADRGQIEQVVMNLCVNARDAMPKGGRLTIETADVELDEIYTRLHPTVKPGSTVMLSVADTGVGMDQETQARIFEPFFTTKEPGKGTGLGLATVYGIVKQSGGNIWFSSDVGKGTVFKIYLPRVEEAIGDVAEPVESTGNRSGSETILLVEDEVDVRDLIREMLASEGYRVIEAANGADALGVAERADFRVDLMMTDVVMPKMSGPELAETLAKSVPGLKVLYMSGYMDKVIVNKGVVDREFLFLEKPFTSAVLLRKVREALDRDAAK